MPESNLFIEPCGLEPGDETIAWHLGQYASPERQTMTQGVESGLACGTELVRDGIR